MKPNCVTIFFLSLLFCGVFFSAKAANPVVHISARPGWISAVKPYDKRPSMRNIENGYYFELSERQINVDLKSDYRHQILEIVSEAGIQNGSQVNVSFDPSYERLDFHDIVIWRNGKPQNRLNAGDFKLIADEADFSKFIYQGSYSANYIIPDVRKGDRIEYSYTVSGSNPVFKGKYAQSIYLQWGQMVGHQYVSLQISAARKLNIKCYNKAAEPVVKQEQGRKQYIWEGFMVQPGTYENNQPDWYTNYARAQVSEFASWGDVANWAMTVNPVQNDLTGELAKRVAALKAESGGDKEKYFRAAVKIAQDEVRYMGIEIGEYSHRANSPANVFKQRYGDCKDKATLLASMLRANGIEAYMVLVHTSFREKVADLLPSSNDFNHAITVATVNGKQIWIDATMSYQRGKGTDIYFPNYRKGLVLRPGSNALTDIPLSKTGNITSKEKYTVVNATDKVRLDVTTTYTLDQADDQRSTLASTGLYATEQNYRKFYAGSFPNIETRDTLIVKDNEEKNELTTIESYLIPKFFKKDSVTYKYKATVYADLLADKLPTISEERKTPVYLSYPYSANHTIEVILPGGWNVAPEEFTADRSSYKFRSAQSVDGDTLRLHYNLTLLKDHIAINDLNQARTDITNIKDNELGYTFTYNPQTKTADGIQTAKDTNIAMLAMAALIVLVFVGVAIWVYRIETPGIVFEYGSSFRPIGGWLVLVSIGLFLTPIGIIINLVSTGYFTLQTWTSYAGNDAEGWFKAMLVFEAAGNTLIMCMAVFCIVLLLNKRDILPKVITVYFLFALAVAIVDYVLSSKLPDVTSRAAFLQMIKTIVIACIWVPYFKRSERVHQTFIVPHPPYNYSYEKAPKSTAFQQVE